MPRLFRRAARRRAAACSMERREADEPMFYPARGMASPEWGGARTLEIQPEVRQRRGTSLHPLFTEVSVLLAYLLPYLVVLPLITRVCLPGWPRFLWGTLYETVVSFTLVRSMLDLVLPKRLGFKVTPKGVLSNRRRF